MSAGEYPQMTPAGADSAIPGFPHLRAEPQADVRHVDLRILVALERVARALGQTLTIISGYRDPAYNARIGGAQHSAHQRGLAADVYLGGSGGTPIAGVPGAVTLLNRAGLASGNVPGFFPGHNVAGYAAGADPEHVYVPGATNPPYTMRAQQTLASRGGGPAPRTPDLPPGGDVSPQEVTGAPGDTGTPPAAAGASTGCLAVVAAFVATWCSVSVLFVGQLAGWW